MVKPAIVEQPLPHVLILRVGADSSIQATLTKCEGQVEEKKGRAPDDSVLEHIAKGLRALRERKLVGDEEGLRELGDYLYQALFPGEVGQLFAEALKEVQQANRRALAARADPNSTRSLRVVLDVDPTSTVARDQWPLELLYYKDFGKWLATSASDLTLSRLIVNQVQPPVMPESLPLRVLLVVGQPSNSDCGGVITADLVRRLAGIGTTGAPGQDKRIEIKVLGHFPDDQKVDGVEYLDRAASFDELNTMADQDLNEPPDRQWRPQVLHFIGHGRLAGSHGQVTLEDVNGGEDSVSAEDFYSVLDRWGLRVVLLQACEAARPGTEAALVKVADYLAERGIPAAISMQLSVTHDLATLFAQGFYEALVLGKDIEEAVSKGRARVGTRVRAADPAFASSVLFTYRPPIALIAAELEAAGTLAETANR